MQTTLAAILDRLAQTYTRASLRRTRKNYTDETHLVYLSLDLREILHDLDESIRIQIPPRRGPTESA